MPMRSARLKRSYPIAVTVRTYAIVKYPALLKAAISKDDVKIVILKNHFPNAGQGRTCKLISSVCVIIFSFKFAMITSDPPRTSNTMSTPNASARILLVLSGPVVM